MNEKQIINWLLEGDIAICYQVHRDLLGKDKRELQNRIETEGWGKQFLSKQNSNGYWGDRFYQPKWISTHYTLLDLRNLNLNPENDIIAESIEQVIDNGKAVDGGIRLGPSTMKHSDVCVNAMFLNYAAYFLTNEKKLSSIVDSIINERMPDGGFNCRTSTVGAKHSSLHTTISVLEGLNEFQKAGYSYRNKEIQSVKKSAEEFILLHQLYISDRTGEIISKDFLKLTYPSRWKYDILRAMDYFQYAKVKWDLRMGAALEQILKKRKHEGAWNMQSPHPGQVHFIMEEAGRVSRWNTLRALRVLKKFGEKYNETL